jgi:hypothetical protein
VIDSYQCEFWNKTFVRYLKLFNNWQIITLEKQHMWLCYSLDDLRIGVLIPCSGKYFSLLKCPDAFWGPPSQWLPGLIPQW